MPQNRPEGRYANAFNVGYNAFEVVLDFVQLYAERQDAWVHSRIITAPSYARLLLETLRESLARYEETYGAIPEAGSASGSPGNEPIALIDISGRNTMPDRSKPESYEPSRPPDSPMPKPPWHRDPGYEPRQPVGHIGRPQSGDYGASSPPQQPGYGPPPQQPGYGPPPQQPGYSPPPQQPGYSPPPQQPGYGPPPQQPGYGPPPQQPGYGPPPQQPDYGPPPQQSGYGPPPQQHGYGPPPPPPGYEPSSPSPGYGTRPQPPYYEPAPPPSDYAPPAPSYPRPTPPSSYGPSQPPSDEPPLPSGYEPPSQPSGYRPSPPSQGYEYLPPSDYGTPPSPPRYEQPPGTGYPPPSHQQPYGPQQPSYGAPSYPPQSTYGAPGEPPPSSAGYQSGPAVPTQPYDDQPQEPKPTDQLEKLKAALERQDTAIKNLTKQRDSLKDDVGGLEKTVGDLAKIVSDYKDACKDFDQQKRELDLYVATKTPMLDVAVRDKKPQIEQCITSIDAWIEDWRRYGEYLEWATRHAEKQSTAATKNADKEQKEYDALKNSAQQLDAKLKELKDLRATIEKEDDKNKTANMYFLLKDLKVELAKIILRTPDELQHALYKAWNELSQAKSTARETKGVFDKMTDEAAAAKKKYEEAVAVQKRRETILDCIEKCTSTPATTAPTY